ENKENKEETETKKQNPHVSDELDPLENEPTLEDEPEFLPQSSIDELNVDALELEQQETDSPNLQESAYEIYIHILNANERNEILEILSQLPAHITGFSEEEFIAAFESQDLIKIAFL